MKKIIHIIKGWSKAWGLLPVSKAEEKLSALRMRSCGKCEHAQSSKILQVMNGNAHYEHRLKCNECGCPCLEKTLVVDESCPIGKW